MNLQQHNLKMSLQDIRNSINLNNTNWINISTTNCYAFALGLDINEDDIIENAYVPGTISNSQIKIQDDFIIHDFFKYTDFITNLYTDLEHLNISFREITPNERISSSEWKIAIFTTPCSNGCKDFHFLRLCNDGIWHHKKGYGFYPTIYDDQDKIITNIEKCFLTSKKYEKCLSLKLR